MHKKYIICTTARSGSNLMCDYLRNTKKAGDPTEFLNPLIILNGYGKKCFPHNSAVKLADYLDWAASEHSTQNNVFGIKILFEHLEYFQKSDALKELFDNSYLIYLERQNKVQQAVSYFLAQETGVWAHYDKPRRPPDDVVYDVGKLRNRYNSLLMQDRHWRIFFDENKYSPLVVAYENFVKDVSAQMQQILAHIHVNDAEITIATTMKAQRSPINEDFYRHLTEDLKYHLGGGTETIYEFNGVRFL